jgi:[NiFe] hydrogenase diaphorase moiety large subunit
MIVTRLNPGRIEHIAALIEAQVPPAQWPPEWSRVDDQIRLTDVKLGTQPAPGEALAAAMARGPQGMLDDLKRSKLRGRGGAGYATATKWQLCRNAPGQTRYVVCNADEGEPGTFKDRVLLTSYADGVIEGMTIGAWVVGARRGLIYLRGEYRYLLERLQAVLQRRREQRLLGEAIQGRMGFDFDIEIHIGAGAYVCGEESALIESLEGKRGTPRIRPPFPVESGYLGQPTTVNNVETFSAVTHIALHGGEWWSRIGTPQSTGTKIHSVSGDCERPGIYEYPFGTRIGRILEDCGARDTQAVQVGGPSGCACRHSNSIAALALKMCPPLEPSWCSTARATCSPWPATSRTSLPTRAAASARRAGSAQNWWCAAWKSSSAATVRLRTCRCCSSWTS